MLLRPAQPADALAIARVHVRAWQHGYAGLLPASYLNQLRPEDRAEKYDLSHADPSHPHTIVATDADIISPTETSSLATSPTTPPTQNPRLRHHSAPRTSPTFPITASSPPSMSIPIPGAAASASRSSPPPAPISSLSRLRHAYLFTLVDNLRAQHFYKSDQWTPDGLTRTDTVWGAAVHVLRFQRNL